VVQFAPHILVQPRVAVLVGGHNVEGVRDNQLIGYGPELQNLFMQAGVLVRKALQGNAIADLPVERPTRFRLVANLVTARALGLTMPTSILLSADEVIE
jgi:putative ABC transport system substrate-binding protein